MSLRRAMMGGGVGVCLLAGSGLFVGASVAAQAFSGVSALAPASSPLPMTVQRLRDRALIACTRQIMPDAGLSPVEMVAKSISFKSENQNAVERCMRAQGYDFIQSTPDEGSFSEDTSADASRGPAQRAADVQRYIAQNQLNMKAPDQRLLAQAMAARPHAPDRVAAGTPAAPAARPQPALVQAQPAPAQVPETVTVPEATSLQPAPLYVPSQDGQSPRPIFLH